MLASLAPVLFSGDPYPTAAVALDFLKRFYKVPGARVSDPSNLPGWSFTRASVATAEDSAGNVYTFASGVPRITDKGLLVEESRTNLLPNSATLATQSATVTAQAYTLSFRGTGTVTLTGTSTAGPLVGTGANTRVSLTFTPTAGTLTLTVSGSVTLANLEAGSFPTSWIPTLGSSATRAADAVSVTGLGVSNPTTLFFDVSNPPDGATLDGSLQHWFGGVASGSGNASGVFAPSDVLIQGGVSNAGDPQISVAGGLSTYRVALAQIPGTGVRLSVLGSAVSTGPNSISGGTNLVIGARNTAVGRALGGYVRRVATYPGVLPDAQLQALTQ